MENHVKILAVIRIICGSLGALAAIICLLVFGGIAGLVGTVGVHEDPEAWIAVPILTAVGGFIFLFIALISIPSLVAGIGLLKHRNWARLLTIVISAIDLVNVPIGTAIGVYGLWVLLSGDTEPLFRRHHYSQATG